jgi:hypothetical protein
MSEFTRRAFLKTSSAAVVAAGALAAAPALPAAVGALESTGPADTGAADAAIADAGAGSLAEPLIAHVRDLATGEIGLFTGTREVTVLDPSLAARLARAIR